ncbi:DUF1207 domain-containing protein [Bacteroidota bacterium]
MCFAQDNSKAATFLPEGTLFHPLIFDPAESQYYGGYFLLNDSGNWNEEMYIPFTISLNRPAVRFTNENYEWEIGFEGTCFTQFNILNLGNGMALGTMLNADYKGGIYVNGVKDIFSLRLRLFHISSHFADDYILRDSISPRTTSELDYEQADFTFAVQKNEIRLYFGSGLVVSPHTVRKRFSLQTGGYYLKQFPNSEYFAFLTGADIKIYQQNNYRPNTKIGAGLEVGKSNRIPLHILFEYYNGHLPYSTLEYKHVQWFGISLSFRSH